MKKLPFEVHPAAEVFPMIKGRAFAELVEDVREHGVKEPIVFWDGKLLDGRNRSMACIEVGLDPLNYAVDIEGGDGFDPVAYVLSANLHRRHLGETEREAIAAKIANLEHGGDRKSEEIKPQNCGLKTTAEAAEQLNVKPRNVESAKAAIKGGCKELVAALEAGEIKSSTADKFVKAVPDKKEQARILAEGLPAVRQAIKESKADQSRPSNKASTPKDKEPDTVKSAPKTERQFFVELRSLYDAMDDYHRQHSLDMWSDWLQDDSK